MVAVLIALAVSYVLTRHIAIMPLVTAVIVLVFGGLTLVLHDETSSSSSRPSSICCSAARCSAGFFGKPLLGVVVRFGVRSDRRRLAQADLALGAFSSLRWPLLNEIVWRTLSTDFWVSFKLFGVVPLTFLFGALQYPLI